MLKTQVLGEGKDERDKGVEIQSFLSQVQLGCIFPITTYAKCVFGLEFDNT